MAPRHKHNFRDSDSGSDSGSESGGNESGGTLSSSDDSVRSKENGHIDEQSKSRSPSPVDSLGSVTPRSHLSSNSADERHSGANHVDGYQANDASLLRSNANGSRSPSPASRRSGSVSPERGAESRGSRSPSPAVRSNASEKISDHSRSPSADSHSERSNVKEHSRSRSGSEASNVSRPLSGRSRSASAENESEKKSRKQSHSPMSNHCEPMQNDGHSSRENSRAGSRTSNRSRSSSKNRSDSELNSNRGSPRKSLDGKNRSCSPHSDGGANESITSPRSKSPQSIHNDKDDHLIPDKVTSADKEHAHSQSESDEESEPKNSPRKRRRAVISEDSGSDEGGNKKKTAHDVDKDERDESMDKELVIDAEDLFGNASDISSEDEDGHKEEKLLAISEKDGEAAKFNEEEDEEDHFEKDKSDDRNENDDIDKEEDKENEREEQQMETRIDVEVPKITMNLGRELHFVKLPNFLSVETRPFYKNNYEDEIDEEETLDEEGRARLKLKVENTIRWREVAGKDGELVKQSNARFVRWSDGSMSLHLGSEIFDVYKQSLHGDHNHLFIRQGTGLQGQAVFRTKLTFRPHSTESFTHRKMTMSLADRSQKTTGIKVLSLVGKDPEAHRGELIKKEEERLRASVRRASKQKRIREKAANRGLSANYLEPDRYMDVDSDDEVISINAIKKQHQNKLATKKGERPHIYSSDEEGSDIETIRARRLDKAKALKDSDSEEGSGGGEGGAAGDADTNEGRDGSSGQED